MMLCDRFYVTDACESAFFVKYVREDDQECSMHIFADDVAPRYVTSMLPLDRDTVAVSDNLATLPPCASPKTFLDEIESDISGGKHTALAILRRRRRTQRRQQQTQACAQFHVGDVICSLTKCALQTGGSEVIVYATRRRARRFVPFAVKMKRFLLPSRDALAHRGAANPWQRARCLPFLLLPSQGGRRRRLVRTIRPTWRGCAATHKRRDGPHAERNRQEVGTNSRASAGKRARTHTHVFICDY